MMMNCVTSVTKRRDWRLGKMFIFVIKNSSYIFVIVFFSSFSPRFWYIFIYFQNKANQKCGKWETIKMRRVSK